MISATNNQVIFLEEKSWSLRIKNKLNTVNAVLDFLHLISLYVGKKIGTKFMLDLIERISNLLQHSSFSTKTITTSLILVVIAILLASILQANEITFKVKDFIEVIVKK